MDVEDGVEQVHNLFLIAAKVGSVLAGRDHLQEDEIFFLHDVHEAVMIFLSSRRGGKWQQVVVV